MPSLFVSENAVGYAKVAVERGVDRYPHGLTYGIPSDLADLAVGERVVVPLGRGNSRTAGYVVDVAEATDVDPESLKLVVGRDAGGVRLPAQLIDLAQWIASYYAAPIGMTLAGMLPAAVKRGVGRTRRTFVDLTTPSEGADKCLTPETSSSGRLSKQQRRVLDVLSAIPAGARPVEIRSLADQSELATTGPIKRLLEKGLVVATQCTQIEASWAAHTHEDHRPDQLTRAQGAAVEAIGAALAGGFSAHLLLGVTGSGKTEVYLRLIEQALARDTVSLLLVPEIALTPQTGGRLLGRFANRNVAILHSGLTAAQRHQQWSLVAQGEAEIIIGARSAVFAPIPDDRLGLVIIDEEHDGSYKQDQVPRYHGRDVAVRRAQMAGCPVVMGSATPSLESWHNATVRSAYTLHRLPDRVPGARLPRVTVVDFMEERKKRHDRRVHLLGPILEDRMDHTLRTGGQVLLFLNRRGYANYIACPNQMCGWLLACDECDVTMVYHRNDALPAGGFVQCHHCEAQTKLPETCPDCGKRVNTFGLGTQRVEEELLRKFPMLGDGAMVRVDSDTMRRGRDYHELLERFGKREIKVLVGTQMIAKGLDYPGIRLVGVINADTAANLPDFRAAERTFQLVSQVSGRTGRGEEAGAVIVQSMNPAMPAIALAAQHDYEAFAAQELAVRRDHRLPPWSRMLRVVVRDEDMQACAARIRTVAQRLTALADDDMTIRGPAPCPISRIAGRHRHQVEVMSPSAVALQRLLAQARNEGVLKSNADMVVDVDPVALL